MRAKISIAAGLFLAAALATQGGAQDVVSDMAPLNEQASRLDPEDYSFMAPVCTTCHTPALYLHSRTWSQWRDVIDQMRRYGTEATPEQWTHIDRYLARSLTEIDLNHADEDELMAVLGVDEKTAILIVQRRSDHPFRTVADIEAVPGVDRALIESMEPRLAFNRPPQD